MYAVRFLFTSSRRAHPLYDYYKLLGNTLFVDLNDSIYRRSYSAYCRKRTQLANDIYFPFLSIILSFIIPLKRALIILFNIVLYITFVVI